MIQITNEIEFAFFEQVIEEFRDLPSRFGTTFPINGLRGYAVYPSPHDACKNITLPPYNNNNTKAKWIALITRYVNQ